MASLARVALASHPAPVGELLALALDAEPSDVASALELGSQLGTRIGTYGGIPTMERWEILATLGAHDLGVARAIEPHLDALSILAEAEFESVDHFGASWGVFAAEGGDDPLRATRAAGAWSLTGTKPWCSLADRLDNALVTAHLPDGGRGLFAVRLREGGVHAQPGSWRARGLSEIPSGPVTFLDVRAQPVGRPDWYLTRPGFTWGGIGVAACWYGGAVGIARTMFASVADVLTPLIAMHLGQIDVMLQSARRALAESAAQIDEGTVADGAVLAKRVRAAVVVACEGVLLASSHALGPGPLALDADHAKRVADLGLYIRQHHAEKDDALLGSALAATGSAPW
jgi:alkylation response protein AidB-like acyl-CoA dehydrogenase